MTEATTRFRRPIGLDVVLPLLATLLLAVPSATAREDGPGQELAFPGRVI